MTRKPIALILALIRLGEFEPARALGEETLQRCRRVLGPEHTATLFAATAWRLEDSPSVAGGTRPAQAT